MPTPKPPTLPELREGWLKAWPAALAAWSPYTRLRPPMLCLTQKEAAAEGLEGSFAMIRLADQSVVVSLPKVVESKVAEFATEILAHEVGHHVLAPANLTDHARCIARMRAALPTLEGQAPMVANLYTDLLINDRLQRSANLRQAGVYKALAGPEAEGQGAVWKLYLRIYEILWSLRRGALGHPFRDDRLEGDAQLGARLVRSFARDWLDGAGRFASLLFPHLVEDAQSMEAFGVWHDTRAAGLGGFPDGLSEMEDAENEGAIHPSRDPRLNGEEEGSGDIETFEPGEASEHQEAKGQRREPFEFGEILRAAGVSLDDHELAVRYYRERAIPHLVPFPSEMAPESRDPLPEGVESWEVGAPLDALDLFESLTRSPHLIPGITTVQRVWGTERGPTPDRLPIDLDLYVDSSGSMPDPKRQISYLTLAGAIISLSALRAGSRVQAVLWSGKHQVTKTDGFTRDERSILQVLTGFYGGGTQFPIHLLRETYADRRSDDRPVHLLIISDSGVTTMFGLDEKGNDGWEIMVRAFERARGGGSMVLNIGSGWETQRGWGGGYQKLKQARDQLGWTIASVQSWEDLVAFAREFSRRHYVERRD